MVRFKAHFIDYLQSADRNLMTWFRVHTVKGICMSVPMVSESSAKIKTIKKLKTVSREKLLPKVIQFMHHTSLHYIEVYVAQLVSLRVKFINVHFRFPFSKPALLTQWIINLKRERVGPLKGNSCVLRSF